MHPTSMPPPADRASPGPVTSVAAPEETLVADARATLTPSQLVEQKLIHVLKASPVMASQLHRRLRPGPR